MVCSFGHQGLSWHGSQVLMPMITLLACYRNTAAIDENGMGLDKMNCTPYRIVIESFGFYYTRRRGRLRLFFHWSFCSFRANSTGHWLVIPQAFGNEWNSDAPNTKWEFSFPRRHWIVRSACWWLTRQHTNGELGAQPMHGTVIEQPVNTSRHKLGRGTYTRLANLIVQWLRMLIKNTIICLCLWSPYINPSNPNSQSYDDAHRRLLLQRFSLKRIANRE